MVDVLFILALLLCTAGSFFFSGVETGIYAMNRVKLRVRAEAGDRGAGRALRLVGRPQLLISTILVGNHLANFGASFFCQGIVRSGFRASDPELVNTLLLTPFLFVFGELTPKNTFRLRADRLVCRTSGLLAASGVVLRPLALLLRWLGQMTGAIPRSRPSPDAILSRDRLKTLMGEVADDGVLTPDQGRMIQNVMRISSIPVRRAMVPIDEVDALPEGFDREELVRASIRHGRTRIVVRSVDTGEPVGVASVLDLVFLDREDPGPMVRQVPGIRADWSVDRSLRALKQARQSMGFVEDEAGRVEGIVTMKDLVEEVSGELPVF